MQDLIPTATCGKCEQTVERDAPHTCRTERRTLLADVNSLVKDDLGLLPDLIVN